MNTMITMTTMITLTSSIDVDVANDSSADCVTVNACAFPASVIKLAA